MTRRLAAAAAAAAASLVPVGAAEAAVLPGCVATATMPYWEHHFGAVATGSYDCDGTRAWLTIEVCLESLGENGWENVACDGGTSDHVSSVSAETQGCRYGLWTIRTVTTGWSSAGERHSSASLPVPYLCTPL